MLSSTSTDQILETDEEEMEVYWQAAMAYCDEPETVEETPIISNKRKTESKLDDLVAINPKKMQLDVPTTSSTNNDIDFHYHKCNDDDDNSTNSDINYQKKQIDNVFDLYAHNCVNRLLKCDILDSIRNYDTCNNKISNHHIQRYFILHCSICGTGRKFVCPFMVTSIDIKNIFSKIERFCYWCTASEINENEISGFKIDNLLIKYDEFRNSGFLTNLRMKRQKKAFENNQGEIGYIRGKGYQAQKNVLDKTYLKFPINKPHYCILCAYDYNKLVTSYNHHIEEDTYFNIGKPEQPGLAGESVFVTSLCFRYCIYNRLSDFRTGAISIHASDTYWLKDMYEKKVCRKIDTMNLYKEICDASQEKVKKEKETKYVERCQKCQLPLGPMNTRQLCGKTYCYFDGQSVNDKTDSESEYELL